MVKADDVASVYFHELITEAHFNSDEECSSAINLAEVPSLKQAI